MPDTDRRPFLDVQRDAALAQIREQADELLRVQKVALGDNSRDRVTEVVKLGEDYVVEVTEPKGRVLWTTVVDGQGCSQYHERQEDAVLHLIARRYDPNPNTNLDAAYYAGRVLGVNPPPRA